MSFGSSPQPQAPAPPPPPPNPPMFGSEQTRGAARRQRTQAAYGAQYGGTVLGAGNPTNTAMKSLLGQ